MIVNPVFSKVYSLVQMIPLGKVTSYGAIARKLDISPRYVGRILHLNPNPHVTPCHRVVHSDGTLPDGYAFGGKHVQKELLEKEGIVFNNGEKIDIKFIVIPGRDPGSRN